MPATRPLQARAERLKAEVQAELDAIGTLETQIATIRETLDAFPHLRTDFAEELRLLAGIGMSAEGAATDAAADESVSESGKKQHTVADQLIEHFRGTDNQPATVNELVAATGLRLTTIQSLLYKPDRNRGRFVSTKLADGTGWQLADAIVEQLWDWTLSSGQTVERAG